MQQGSSLAVSQSSTDVTTSTETKAVLFQATTEVGGLCAGIVHISLYCQNEGHATLEQMEQVGIIAMIMQRSITALGLNVVEL